MIELLLIIIIAETGILFRHIFKKSETRYSEMKGNIENLSVLISKLSDYTRFIENQNNERTKRLQVLIETKSASLNTSIHNASTTLNDALDNIVDVINKHSIKIQSEIQHANTDSITKITQKSNNLSKSIAELNNDIHTLKTEIIHSQTMSFKGLDEFINKLSNENRKTLFTESKKTFEQIDTVNNSIKCVYKIMEQHLGSLKPLEIALKRLENLYKEISELDKRILSQEKSLNSTVDNHYKVLEYTQQLTKTSKDIFDLMKLVLMKSIVDRNS